MNRDVRFNLAVVAVAAVLVAGIAAVVVMTPEADPPHVSCTAANGCVPTTDRRPAYDVDPIPPSTSPRT